MPEHVYDPESGWCRCGHHRDDGRSERDTPPLLTVSEIRDILGPTYPAPRPTRRRKATTT